MSLTLTDQDKQTLRSAAYGAVSLLAAAGAAGGSPHQIATDGSIALASATGPIGHVLADKSTGVKLDGKSVAAIADHVLPALTASMALLKKQDASAAADFRDILRVAIEAATHASKGGATPTMKDMTQKILRVLDEVSA